MRTSKRNSIDSIRFAGERSANRRAFLKKSAAFAAGFPALAGASLASSTAQTGDSGPNLLGPRPGYTPQVGTFVSLLTWMREGNGVIVATKGLTQADLD